MSSHKPLRELQKERLFKRRKKTNRPPISAFLPPKVKVVRDNPGVEKMSEVLWDFVDPYLDSAETEDALRKLLTLGMAAWNAAVAGPTKGEELIRDLEQTLPPEAREHFRVIIDPLIQRKLRYFSDNQRIILDFTLTMQPSGPYLQVASTLPAE